MQAKYIFIVKLQFRTRSGICKLMRPKLQKQSALKLAGRIIPQSGRYNTPQLTAEIDSKACFGIHTRD